MIRKAARYILQNTTNDYFYNIAVYNYHRIKAGLIPRIPNTKNPKTFNEKILWLKLNYRAPNANLLADKYAVRGFVRHRIGDHILIPLYGVYENPAEIDFSIFPDFFVAKPNHASGRILFCNKLSGIDDASLKRTMSKWLSVDYGKAFHEYQYENIERKILIEKDMRPAGRSGSLEDYKLFCFDGEPKFVQVSLDRFRNHTRTYYDLHWNRLPFGVFYKNSDKHVPPPRVMAEMIDIARRLSAGMPFARIDLYEVNGSVYFGEMTLHPDGGVGPFHPDYYDEIVGSYLRLPPCRLA